MEVPKYLTLKNETRFQLDRLTAWLMAFLIFLTPLFFLPFTPEFFEFNKMYLVLGGSLLLLASLMIRLLFNQPVKWFSSQLDLLVFFFLLGFIASSLLVSTNRVLPFLGKTGSILSLTIFYFALLETSTKNWRLWLQALIASAFLLAWLMVFVYLGLPTKFLNWPIFANKAFTPAGTILSFISFELILLPAVIIFALKTKAFLNKVVYFLIAGLILLSSVMAVSLMLPGQPATLTLLPFKIGWWISVDIFKTAKTALLGVGPENFLNAFSQFRPATYNNYSFWQTRFLQSSNEYFTLLTTVGILGLGILFLIFFKIIKSLSENRLTDGLGAALKLMFLVFSLSLLAAPAGFLSWFLFYLMMAMVAKQRAHLTVLSPTQLSKILSGFGLLLAAIFVYLAGRGWWAEAVFKKALTATNANQAQEAYNKHVEAIKLNPFQEKYRLSFSKINFALANSLAMRQDLNDAEKQQVVQLVSQAVNEAKAVTALNPSNPFYWENLAELYRQLINFANGAQDWAIAAYVQALRLDPVNPQTRLALGGILYTLNRYEEALDQFKVAVELKPDLANAYYNLAWAYFKNNNPAQAYLAMQRVLALVSPETEDFRKATQELEQFKEALPPQLKTATGAAQAREAQLQKPAPLPSTPPAGPINLPKEAAPEVSPEPSASPAATTSPKPVPSATP
jgi:tetratricopeptide (TPR) repeat protein